MAQAYPVQGYRHGAPAYQGSGFQRAMNDNFRPHRPANDNWRGPKLPANDNFPKSLNKAFVRRTALSGMSRIAFRSIPYLGLALLVYDLYQLYHSGKSADWTGWTGHDCGGDVNWKIGDYHYSTCSPMIQAAALKSALVNVPQFHDYGFGYGQWEWTGYEHIDEPSQGFVRGWNQKGYYFPITPSIPHPVPLPRDIPITGDEIPYPKLDPIKYEPAISPSIDPLQIPILKPMPTPRPIRYRNIPNRRNNPYRSPREQTHRRYDIPDLDLERDTVIPDVEFWPNETPRIIARRHLRRPPGRYNRERKFIANVGSSNALGRLFGNITEYGDLVDALFDALPEEIRRSSRQTLVGKSQALYRNYDKIDVLQALQNIAINQIQDAAIGKLGKSLAKSLGDNPLYRRPVGAGTGPAL